MHRIDLFNGTKAALFGLLKLLQFVNYWIQTFCQFQLVFKLYNNFYANFTKMRKKDIVFIIT